MTQTTSKCAICKAIVDSKYRPFCSKRCADVDLNRWLNGSYAVPVVEHDGTEFENDDNGA